MISEEQKKSVHAVRILGLKYLFCVLLFPALQILVWRFTPHIIFSHIFPIASLGFTALWIIGLHKLIWAGRKEGTAALLVTILVGLVTGPFVVNAHLFFFASKSSMLSNLPQKSRDAEARRSLADIRSAIDQCFKKTGTKPGALDDLVPHYLADVPAIRVHRHKKTRLTTTGPSLLATDTGGWLYVSEPTSASYGTVIVNCTHADSRGITWSTY